MNTLKFKKLTVIIASSLCLWNIDIASGNAVQLTFTNNTDQIATGFHVKIQEIPDGPIFTKILDADTPFGPLKMGQSYTLSEQLSKQFIRAEWSFAAGKNKSVWPNARVPEPTTIFGSALALGVGGWLKRKKSSQQNKITSHH
jgi:hypothetical protein